MISNPLALIELVQRSALLDEPVYGKTIELWSNVSSGSRAPLRADANQFWGSAIPARHTGDGKESGGYLQTGLLRISGAAFHLHNLRIKSHLWVVSRAMVQRLGEDVRYDGL